MSVSVIVASLGAAVGLQASLASVLVSLTQLDSPSAELILALNGPTASRDGVPGIRHPLLRVIRLPRTGAAHARNEGMKAAANPIVLFTDDDCQVPASWCHDHLITLQGSSATAAPIHVPHRGPITHYLDYKRIFIAPPLTTHTCRYFVTANCGVNRALLPWQPRFDDAHFNNAAEDAALGYQIAACGEGIRWLSSVPPVVHALEERPEGLIERSFRYGAGNATLVDVHGRWQESSPYTDDWLTSILTEKWRDYRRFPELADQEVRALFTSFNIIETAVWLIGYLTRTQESLGAKVFAIDRTALESSLSDFLEAVTGAQRRTSPATPPGEPGFAPDAGCPPRPANAYREIAAILRRAVVSTGDQAAQEVLRTHLRTHRDRIEREQARVKKASLDTWGAIHSTGQNTDMARFEAALRSQAVTLPDALSELEKIPNLLAADTR